MNILESIEKKQIINKLKFKVGDLIRVSEVDEMLKKKIKLFQGLVISIKNKQLLNCTFKLRKITKEGIVEKTFFLHSRDIKDFTIIKNGEVRKSKLFYTRNNKSKISKIFKKKVRRGA